GRARGRAARDARALRHRRHRRGGRRRDVPTARLDGLRRSALEIVDAGEPGEAGTAPALLLDRLRRGLRVRVLEPVGVEDAVEVVVLVLEDAGEPAARLDLVVDAVEAGRAEDGARRAAQRVSLAGDRQAALRVLVLVGGAERERGDPQRRVDRDALVARARL